MFNRTNPPTRRGLALTVAATLLVSAVAAWFVSRPPADEEGDAAEPQLPLAKPDPPDEGGYVGSTACVECHGEIARSYAAHPMAKAMAPVQHATPIEDYSEQTSFVAPGGREYRVERRAKGVFHHERATDADGEVIYDQKAPIAYALGSGIRGRSYLIERDGLLFGSPIAWYTGSGSWGLAPGYEAGAHRRFERRITDACLHCHSGGARIVRGALNRFQSPPVLEYAIGCERCHGPGRAHVAFHRDGAGRDRIVNPGELAPFAREDVCNQCHLQGVTRFTRYGCEFPDFRPGQRLDDVMAVFVRPSRASGASARAVSQVQQLRASRCFQASAGQMGCTSCHDPHGRPSAPEKVAFYRRRCLNCHQVENCGVPVAERRELTANDSCIQCHMPKSPAMDVPHTAQTDHRVLKRPEEEPVSSPPGADQESLVLFDRAEARLPDTELARVRGLLSADLAVYLQDAQLAREAQRLLEPVVDVAPDDVAAWEALGIARTLQQQHEAAADAWRQALSLDPDRETTLKELAIALHERGQLTAALPLLERYLEVNPWRAEMWGRHAHLLGRLGRWERALDSAERGLQLDPSMASAYLWMVDAYRRIGDKRQAEHYRRTFQRLQSAP